MFVYIVAIAIILPTDIVAENTTAISNATTVTIATNETTTIGAPTATTTANFLNTTAVANITGNATVEDSSNVTEPTTTTSSTASTALTTTGGTTAESTTLATTLQITETTTTAATEASTTTTDSTTASTTVAAPLLVTDIVKQNWSSIVSATNFTSTVLSDDNVAGFNETDFLEAVIQYYITTNATILQDFLEDNRIDVVASAILDNITDVLDSSIRQRFTSALSLQGFLASMYWMKDYVLSDNGDTMTSYVEAYNMNKSGDAGNASMSDFVEFILANASGSEMFDGVCAAASSLGVTESTCTAQPTPTVKAIEKFTSSWPEIASYNFTNIADARRAELAAITSDNMTDALATYVSGMPDEDIRTLLAANATAYASNQLRVSGNSISDSLGSNAVTILGNNETTQDVYFLYLNFMVGLTSSTEQFATLLDTYSESNSTNGSRRKRSVTCDRSSIDPDGLVCHMVTVTARNVTYLAETVCNEFEDPAACTATFVIDDTTATSSRLSIGAIVGIAIGGFFGLVILIILCYVIWRRCCKSQAKVNPQNDRHSNGSDIELHENRDNGRQPNGTATRRISSNS